ncbi:branched-chain amino acid ABC transporter permease [Nocardioides sp. LHD-245]|uniref:branched-chain amino acid ABC transporter permease n=1 Tax=Nocardioides sp. LHD-245 TaxID=3051387 RepID=UPI0027DF6B3E|nr:branched-chain amino acid ABC transporter permease [Nocardioides sp. LHD-245]
MRGRRDAAGVVRRRRKAWELWITIGLLVVLPLISATDYSLHIWTRMAIFLILLTGLNLIQGVAGMTSLAQAGFFGLGAYAAGISAVRYDLPPLAALVVAPVVVTLVALLVGVLSMRLKEIYFTMATLGAGFVLFLLFGRMVELTGGPNGLVGIPPFSIGGLEFTEPIMRYALVAVLAALGAVVAHNLLVSRTGRALRAYGASEPAALAVGASPFRLRLLAFGLSGFYAGVAGALEAFDARFISPSTFDFMTAVLLVVALVVSGAGRMVGPILGALLLTGIEVFAADYADYEPLIMGVIFLVAVQLFPRGVAGELAARWEDRRERAQRSGESLGDSSAPAGTTRTDVGTPAMTEELRR